MKKLIALSALALLASAATAAAMAANGPIAQIEYISLFHPSTSQVTPQDRPVVNDAIQAVDVDGALTQDAKFGPYDAVYDVNQYGFTAQLAQSDLGYPIIAVDQQGNYNIAIGGAGSGASENICATQTPNVADSWVDINLSQFKLQGSSIMPGTVLKVYFRYCQPTAK